MLGRMSQTTGTGMPLRDYRIHRYVNAFCPQCHEEDPDRELSQVGEVDADAALGEEGQRPDCVGRERRVRSDDDAPGSIGRKQRR